MKLFIASLAGNLDSRGYHPADHLKDFGYEIPNVLYAKKLCGKDWVYLSAMFPNSDGPMLEAVVEVYAGKDKNTRDKGQRPEKLSMYRTVNELLENLP